MKSKTSIALLCMSEYLSGILLSVAVYELPKTSILILISFIAFVFLVSHFLILFRLSVTRHIQSNTINAIVDVCGDGMPELTPVMRRDLEFLLEEND